jgi:hypothetical protein
LSTALRTSFNADTVPSQTWRTSAM